LELPTESEFKDMWRNYHEFVAPSRRLPICTLLQNNFRCTLRHFANKRNTPGTGVGGRPMWRASVDSSGIVTAKATIHLALPNSVQWRIRVTIDTLCVALYSLVSVVVN
jgi:hypothetical protein